MAQAVTITDIRNVDDKHVTSDIKSALYDFSPAIIGHGKPDYPSGRVVVIPVETPDFPRNTYVTPANVFNSAFVGGPSTYYRVASGCHITLKGHVTDWTTIGTKLADYKSTGAFGEAVGLPYYPSEHSEEFMKAVLEAGSVNWKELDANNDGKISRSEAAILLLIPNRDNPPTGFGWATNTPQWIGQVTTSAGTFDFGTLQVIYLSVTKASQQASTGYNFLYDQILSTIVHELLHAFFDLPDRYNYPGLGSYCILSDNNHWILLNPHDRMKLGWIRPRILTPDHGNLWLEAPTAAATQSALILLDPARPDEYWLLENRNKSGSVSLPCDTVIGPGGTVQKLLPTPVWFVESGLSTEGLAVWWVRARALTDGSDDVRLVPASAPDQDPDGKGINPTNGAALDPAAPGYNSPGNQDLFDTQIGPRILRYSDGTPSKFGLYSISPPGETVTLWIGTEPPPSVTVSFKPDTSPHRAHWGGTVVRPPPQTRPPMPPQPPPNAEYKRVSPVGTPRVELEDGSALLARSTGRTQYWVRIDVEGRTVTTFDPQATVVRSSTGDIAVITEPGGQPQWIGRARATRPRFERRRTRERSGN